MGLLIVKLVRFIQKQISEELHLVIAPNPKAHLELCIRSAFIIP
jgi:hypothetical protein